MQKRASPISVVVRALFESRVRICACIVGYPSAQPNDHELRGVQVIGAVEASMPPPPASYNATMVQTVYLKTMSTTRNDATRQSKGCDGIDEISPCAADEEPQSSAAHERAPSGSAEVDLAQEHAAHCHSAALEIQEEEDAALARRLAEEGQWVSGWVSHVLDAARKLARAHAFLIFRGVALTSIEAFRGEADADSER